MKNLAPVKKEERAVHLLPVRVTEKEYKQIKKATSKSGDRYMIRFMRRAVMETVERMK